MMDVSLNTQNRTDEEMEWHFTSLLNYECCRSTGSQNICLEENYVAALQKKYRKVPSLLNLAIQAVSRYQLLTTILPAELREMIQKQQSKLWLQPECSTFRHINVRLYFQHTDINNLPPCYPLTDDLNRRLTRILTNYCPGRLKDNLCSTCPYI